MRHLRFMKAMILVMLWLVPCLSCTFSLRVSDLQIKDKIIYIREPIA